MPNNPFDALIGRLLADAMTGERPARVSTGTVDLAGILGRSRGTEADDHEKPFSGNVPELMRQLHEMFERMRAGPKPKVGDFVVWKDGLHIKTAPGNGEPAIVMEVLDEPVFDQKVKATNSAFREPIDMAVGIIRRGHFIVYWVDSRRFKVIGSE